jgi:hypothetical protein
MSYSITTKDGITINNIPDNVDPNSQELKDRVAGIRAGNQMPTPEEPAARPNLTAGQVASGAITNFPSSLGNLVGNVVSAVTSPIQTAKSVVDLGAGILQNVLPERLVQAVGEDKGSREVANQVGKFYVDRYGSVEGAKRAIAEDPAGVLADVSTVLSGGSMVASRVGLGSVAQPLARAASAIDPLAATVRATGAVANFAGKNLVAPLLGTTTGAGRESISQAFKAGQKGGDAAEQFRANISGRANPTEILDIAKSNLDELNLAKQAEYRSGMVNIKNDKSILEFKDIEKATQDATKKVTYKGQITNATAAEKLQDAQQKINTWKNLDPAEFHTPEGLDALKKQIGETLETIDFTKQKVAYSAVSDIYKSIKSSIQKQAPTYAQTMKAYTDASDQIAEIQKTLSLNNKATTDTAMRKLLSLVRDNVQTNYGQRLNLAKTLEAGGGQEFLPGVAGQALSSVAPRSLQSVAAIPTSMLAYGSFGGGVPGVIAGATNAALSSPRLVGELAYGTGAASRGAREFGRLVPPGVDPRLYNLLYQSGQLQGLLGE